MPLVFSYGSLQRSDVQIATFNRLLDGRRDHLPGFRVGRIPIRDPAVAAALGTAYHANAEPTGNPHDQVEGTAFEIAEDELRRVDIFEQRDGYGRRAVTLASGRAAWVYVYERPQSRTPPIAD